MRILIAFVFIFSLGGPAFSAPTGKNINASFIRAANQDSVSRLEALVDKDSRYWNSDVLEIAIARRLTAIVRILISHQVDVNARPSVKGVKMMSPLGAASLHAYGDIVKILLAHGAETGNSLADAVAYPSPSIKEKERENVVLMLLKAGADVNAISGGLTALDWAAANGETPIVKILLSQGARVDATRGQKTNAIAVAERNGHRDIVRILKAALKSKKSVKKRGMP